MHFRWLRDSTTDKTPRFLNSRDGLFSFAVTSGFIRVSTRIRTSQRMSLLDESRWKKHGERYATAIADDRTKCLALAVIDARSEKIALRDAYGHRRLRCIGKHRTHRG
ncbi:hypothetical protein AVEN_35331-1 [Araneus ventricosus]|uniref:Uncharacterized protein n=1 Tax=Araneus ventricosus TaxID=182803 RepID=A0A4Y2U787_ARAVE|nr:hypothetical protein AVEN_251091-1 [Araneus ventricosus]GBO08679.1 hypothetical protein AVEN_35331-1 [Araneus ventricosus]